METVARPVELAHSAMEVVRVSPGVVGMTCILTRSGCRAENRRSKGWKQRRRLRGQCGDPDEGHGLA